LRDLLPDGIARLRAAGIGDAPRDARLLLAHAAGIAPDRLALHLSDPVPPGILPRWQAALAARVARQPVSQITGSRLFWGRSFRVTPDTLDPRPETETLIAEALARPFARVLDLGTGTGCILITLLAERPGATGTGTDISPAALAVAAENARAFGLADRATFRHSDWFDGAAGLEGPWDLILSNPPYIGADEIAGLAPEVRDWEPRGALTPGADALAAYRQIAPSAARRLAPGGRLIVEIGAGQGPAVAAILAEAGLSDIAVRPDMDGRDRIVAAGG
jgi:release factor glutamine methyltransferase